MSDPLLNWLQREREKNGIFISDLADLAGVKRQYLSSVLNGKNPLAGRLREWVQQCHDAGRILTRQKPSHNESQISDHEPHFMSVEGREVQEDQFTKQLRQIEHAFDHTDLNGKGFILTTLETALPQSILRRLAKIPDRSEEVTEVPDLRSQAEVPENRPKKDTDSFRRRRSGGAE